MTVRGLGLSPLPQQQPTRSYSSLYRPDSFLSLCCPPGASVCHGASPHCISGTVTPSCLLCAHRGERLPTLTASPGGSRASFPLLSPISQMAQTEAQRGSVLLNGHRVGALGSPRCRSHPRAAWSPWRSSGISCAYDHLGLPVPIKNAVTSSRQPSVGAGTRPQPRERRLILNPCLGLQARPFSHSVLL